MIDARLGPVPNKSFKISVSDSGKETDDTYLPDKWTLPDRKEFVDTPACQLCTRAFGVVITGRHHW